MPTAFRELQNEVAALKAELQALKAPPQKESALLLKPAAEYLGIAEQTLYNGASSRKIPSHKIGRRLYFFKSELDSFIRSNGKRYTKGGVSK
ncbi:helix-turn-helix domain-containing protein [Pollutibacter soli]|uniref:helix-turn-helix domain-containing protein n=1 Tax=Pollutibacter soli TaxID=3034157 RepID=UPI0030138715